MSFLESLSIANISSWELIKVALLVLIGIVLGIVVKFFIKKLAQVTIYPWIRKSSPSSYKRTVSGINLAASIVQWTIIVLFIFQALSVFQIFLLEEILKISVAFIPKLAVASIVVVIGLLITSIISRKISGIEFRGSELTAKIFIIIFVSATILSALEIINVKLTAFMYIFAAGLFAIGLAVAIAVGIAFGLALKPEVSKIIGNIKRQPKEQAKSKFR